MPAFRPPVGTQPRGKLRILVADDEDISRRLLQAMLVPHGACTFAADGVEALAKWEDAWRNDTPFHLLCLDILMPGLDGQAVLSAIRTWESAHEVPVNRATRVIMVTGLDDSRSVMTAFRNQCEAYLLKPIDPDELEERLHGLGLTGVRTDTDTEVYHRRG